MSETKLVGELCEALEKLLTAVEGAASTKRGDFYHERKAARTALAKAREDSNHAQG